MPHICNAWCSNGGHALVVLAGNGLTPDELWDIYRAAWLPWGFVTRSIRPVTEANKAEAFAQAGQWYQEGSVVAGPRQEDLDNYTAYLAILAPCEET